MAARIKKGDLVQVIAGKDKGEKGFKRFKELIDSTVVVFIAMLLLGAFVAFIDLVMFNIIEMLTK